MNVSKDTSQATASQDLKKQTELNLLHKVGQANKSKYLAAC